MNPYPGGSFLKLGGIVEDVWRILVAYVEFGAFELLAASL